MQADSIHPAKYRYKGKELPLYEGAGFQFWGTLALGDQARFDAVDGMGRSFGQHLFEPFKGIDALQFTSTE